MGFKEDLQRLSLQVTERMQYITNEEMTKQSLIIPFIQVLGFDVFNPLEVRPEFDADFGKKKGEKVDYALFKDGNAVTFIEAKSVTEKLTNHDAQLSRYFNAVPDVKLGIITNGVEYRFFTDLTADNIMDDKPFLIINLTNLKDSDIETLSKFKKDSFNTDNLLKFAEELVYTSALDSSIKELLKNPNDEFVRFLIKDFSNVRVTTNVIERFRPLVKKAISNAVLDIVSKGLYRAEEESTEDKIEPETECVDEKASSSEIPKKKLVTTTSDELKVFEFIKSTLSKNGRSIDNIFYKDTTNYFSVCLNSTTKWFLRINLDSSNKNIMTKLSIQELQPLAKEFSVEVAPKGIAESRILINGPKDIEQFESLILRCYDDIN